MAGGCIAFFPTERVIFMKLYQRKENDPSPIAQADPYILKAKDGRYYVYTSGGYLISSDQLFSGWQYHGVCLDMPDQKMCWAPCVVELDEQYMMYYSSLDQDSNDPHNQRLRVAQAESPRGPFHYVKDLLPPFSIDPHMVQNASGLYMFYSGNDYMAKRAGTLILCDKMTNPYTLEGNPVCVARPTLDEEIFEKNRFGNHKNWHTVEGAFYFHKDNTHFLMYSGACYQNQSYYIGYYTAHGTQDADLRTLPWKKYPNENTYYSVMNKANGFVEGMGHNSVLYENGKYYIIYHGRDIGSRSDTQDTRCARIDELMVNGDRLSAEVTP